MGGLLCGVHTFTELAVLTVLTHLSLIIVTLLFLVLVTMGPLYIFSVSQLQWG